MSTHGTLTAFDPEVSDWSIYIEQLKHYFIANDIGNADKKRAILLSVCGTPTYKLMRSLVTDLNTATFDELVQLVANHYEPKPSVIVQRFNFNRRTRASGETVAIYVAALRELALHCEFGDRLQEMLRDRLVCGINHRGIQRKLLTEADLTFDRAYALAQSVESSERDSKSLAERPQEQGAAAEE